MATKIGELTWVVDTDTKKAEAGLKSTETKAKSTGKAFSSLGTLIKGAFAVAAVAGIAKVSKALIKAASDAEETNQKFSVTFQDVTKSANDAAANLADGYGLSRTAAKGLLADTGDLLSGFGFTGSAALDLSTQVNELAVDLASFTNFSGGAEGASAALTKGLLGERESMKSLGIAISEADIKQLAEDKGITGELDRQTKAMLTLELAVGQSKNAIGDFERSQSSFANQSRVAAARIDDLKVSLGDNLLPIANVGVSIFNDFAKQALVAAENLGEFTSSSDGAGKIGDVIGNISGGIAAMGSIGTPILKEIGGAVEDIVTPFQDLFSGVGETSAGFKILGAVGSVISGVISILGTNIGNTVENFIAMGKTITDVGSLWGSFFSLIKGDISLGDFKDEILGVGDSFKSLGSTIVTNIADSGAEIAGFVTGFNDSMNNAADAAQVAFTTTADTISNKVTTALVESGEVAEETGDKIVEENGEIADSYDLNAERLRALQDEYGTLEEVEKSWAEGALSRQIELANTGVGYLLTSFEDLGEALVNGELGWDSFASAGLNAIAAVLQALGSQLAAQAALLIGLAFTSAGVSLAGLPATLAGSAAAYAASGIVSGLAGSFEQGGVVPMVPGSSPTGDKQLVAVNGGETITPADESSGSLSLIINLDGSAIAKSTINNYVNKKRLIINAGAVK